MVAGTVIAISAIPIARPRAAERSAGDIFGKMKALLDDFSRVARGLERGKDGGFGQAANLDFAVFEENHGLVETAVQN